MFDSKHFHFLRNDSLLPVLAFLSFHGIHGGVSQEGRMVWIPFVPLLSMNSAYLWLQRTRMLLKPYLKEPLDAT